MKLLLWFPALLFSFSFRAFSQTLISIPDTIGGNTFVLTLRDSVSQFYQGINTPTIGYNRSYLGPTIILHQGDSVMPVISNQLADTTTTHWHGLHVSPMSDGGPHSLILPGETWMPHFKVLDKAATYWYHPHVHGKTMQQVVKGAAGLIIVRDSEEAALTLPRTYGVDDIPLIFQFQTIDSATKQIAVNDAFDNAVLVNGTLNGMVNAPAQVVRLRLLNASSLRFFRFGFGDNRSFYQIATDGGLLDAPVPLTRLDLSPGERAELLVNLSGQSGDTLILKTYGSELPEGYPGGIIMQGMPRGPLDSVDFTVLQINVTAPAATPVTTIPSALTANTVWPQAGVNTRYFDLSAQPMMSMDNFFINGEQFDMATINFSAQQETVEIWDIENLTFIAHPFHIHGNHFYILSKNGAVPPLNELGRKDVVLVPPMSSVKVITKYADFSDTTMPYMYHCHLLSHEDKGMMGQFIIRPVSPLNVNAFPTDVSCYGGSDGSVRLEVSGGVPPYFYLWSNGDTTQNLTGLTAGNYSVTVTDSYQSTDDFSANILQPSTPIDVGVITGNMNPAANTSAVYSVAVVPLFNYQWNAVNGLISQGQGTHEVTVQWASVGAGELTVVAGNGTCSDTATLTTQIISSVSAPVEFPLRIFQNTADGNITIQIDNGLNTETQIELLNSLGQTLYRSPAEIFSGSFSKAIELTAQKGIFFLHVRINSHSALRKIAIP